MRNSVSQIVFRAISVGVALAVLASPALASNKNKRKKAEKAVAKEEKAQKPSQSNPLAGLDSKQPDKQLFDKACPPPAA